MLINSCRKWLNRKAKNRQGNRMWGSRRKITPRLEALEDRTLWAVSLSNVPQWIDMGPGPIQNNASNDGLNIAPLNASNLSIDGQVGAVESIAVEPVQMNNTTNYIVYAGTVNGGVWRAGFIDNNNNWQGYVTSAIIANASSSNASPKIDWHPMSDFEPSLATSSMALDPNDPSGNTLWVGTGSLSSGGLAGGPAVGLLKTTDGGATWTVLGKNDLAGQVIASVVPTKLTDASTGKQIVLVADGNGIQISKDGGESFQTANYVDQNNQAVPLSGNATDIIADPNNSNRFYAAVVGFAGTGQSGVFESDGGQNWYRIDAGTSQMTSAGDIKLADQFDGTQTILFVATAAGGGLLTGGFKGNVLSAANAGVNSWNLVAIPNNMVPSWGADGFGHFTAAADPTTIGTFYVATYQSGVFRVDSAWTPLDKPFSGTPIANGTITHDDQRHLVFLGSYMLVGNDGGIYALNNPSQAGSQGYQGIWFSLNTNLRDTELYNAQYDPRNGQIFGGAQDNGVPVGSGPSSWTLEPGGNSDGGSTAMGLDHEYYSRANFGDVYYDGNVMPAPPDGSKTWNVAGFQLGGRPFGASTVLSGQLMIQSSGGNLYEITIGGGISMTNVTPTSGGISALSGSVSAITYAVNNANAAYFGTTGGQIWYRSSPGATFSLSNSWSTKTGNATPVEIAVDPFAWQTAYVLDSNGRVWQTTDGATTWNELTGDLGSIASSLDTLTLCDPNPNAAGQGALAVGGFGEVYSHLLGSNNNNWQTVGQGLPNVRVTDLQYASAQNVLVAGTYGRSAFELQSASAALFAANTQTAVEGASQAYNLGSFSDSDGGGPWQGDINWGDGSPDTIFNVAAAGSLGTQSHTYGEEGTYLATFTVTDTAQGDSSRESFPVIVSDPAVVAASVPFSAVEGAAFTGKAVATFTDPGGPEPNSSDPSGTIDDHYKVVSIDWGDGTPLDTSSGAISLLGNTFTVSGNHTYGEEGPYTITAIIDHEGVQTTVQSKATVSDPAVVASGVPVFGVECRTLTVPVTTFTDPGGAEPNPSDPSGTLNNHYQVVSIDWGDGSPLDTTTGTIAYSGAPGSMTDPFTVSGSHAFQHEGTYTVTTTLNHEGISTVATTTAIIKDDIGLLLLDPAGSRSLMVTGNGSVTVTGNGSTPSSGCGAVVVDSSDSRAAFLTGNATVTAEDIDVTGGVKTAGHASFSAPVDHEAATSDPLGLALPAAPATHHAAVHISKGAITLSPGTYDGGIQVTGQAAVTLLPGVYYLKGGGFQVSGHGSVTDNGAGVLIVNAPAGPNDTIRITGQASVSLTAPSSLSAPYAAYQGIMLFQSPASSNPIQFSGQSSVTLTGVAYVPAALVAIDGNANVTINNGAGTATLPPILGALIAYDLKVDGNGVLTINPDDPPSALSSALVLTPLSRGGAVSLAVGGVPSNGGTGSALSAALGVSAGGSAAGGAGLAFLPNGSLLQVIGNYPSLAPTASSAANTSTARQAIVDPLFSVDWGGGMVSSLSDLLNEQRSEELFSHLGEVS